MIKRSFTSLLLTSAICMLAAAEVRADDQRSITVGMPARIDQLILPGSELVVRKIDEEKDPIVLRILNTYRHGTAFRYDLVYYGLEPGKFDLKNYLQRKDGTSTADLPSIEVEIKPVLPPGQIEPNALEAKPAPFLGGYRLALIGAGVVWVAGFFAILFLGRKKKPNELQRGARPLTLADHLQPLVEKAMNGDLSQTEQANLERLLYAFWQKRLQMDDMKPADAMARLRHHDEAGPLIQQLEKWLHQPGPVEPVDVAELLKPYRNLCEAP